MSDEPVIQRRYTLAEIDEMRGLLKLIQGMGHMHYNGNCYMGDLRPKPDEAALEAHLRTYLMAGIHIEEVRSKYREASAAQQAQMAKSKADWEAIHAHPISA